MIELKSFTSKFDNQTILNDINLCIKNHLSILGANGSGKSTLAKSICSLIKYDGEIFIDSKNIKEFSLNHRAKTISYVPAKLQIYEQFITVEEFVLLGRFAYKKNYFDYSMDDKNITQKTLEFLKISHLKKHLVSSLSSGEQQLVLIAAALTQKSNIIIFDEPTANLDPHNSKIIAKHIKELKKYHQIILITHDLHLAYFLNSEVLFIKNKKAMLYDDSFFKDETLQKLYDVKFNNMVAVYE